VADSRDHADMSLHFVVNARQRRRRALVRAAASLLAAPGLLLAARGPAAGPPVLLGFDGEFTVEGSTSAQAIQAGIEIAMAEVNAAGGVLGGRPLQLVTRDNRTMPARAAQHLREFAAMPGLVAVYCGRFSPTVLETIPLVHELQLPLLDPWASADGVIDHGIEPSYTFRLSLKDSWFMRTALLHAQRLGRPEVGLLAVNTGWGRSSERALVAQVATQQLLPAAKGGNTRMVGTRWFNNLDVGDNLVARYAELRAAGARALVFVGNFREGSALVRAVATMPAAERLPLMAHSGVMGGNFFELSAGAMARVDVSVVQSFGLVGARRPRAAAVRAAAMARFGVASERHVPSTAGLAHAYDLTHIVARAIDTAGSTERAALRDALERSRPYSGLIRDYPAPFTRTRHEALAPTDLYMARFEPDGTLVRPR
jgi:branched-chain amino acid transport system substrate-binding protein